MFNPALKTDTQFLAKIALVKLYASEGDILNWGKILFPDKFNLPFCKELHEYFISIKDEPFTATLAPRGYAKTAIKCFLIPLFQALNDKDTYRHHLNIQKTSTKAVNVNLSIRQELSNNELLIEVYGDMHTDKWTEKQFTLKNDITFSALGAGDSIRGLQVDNKRPDNIICDDLYDDDESNNVLRIEKVNDWFWSSVYPALPKHGKRSIHLQGTAANKFDLIHQVAERSGWKFRKFQAIKDDVKKLVLWPEVETYERLLMHKENMGSVRFERELMNNCRDNETQIIKDHWIQYYDSIPSDEKLVMRIAGNDPSIGAKEESDYTALAVIYVTRKDESYRYYICDLVNEHLSQDKRIRMVDNKHTVHKFRTVFVEAIAGFKDYCAELKRQTNVPVKEIDWVKDKITNLENNSSKFETGKVFISKAIPDKLRNELVYQLTTNFPRHDDLRDSVLVCLNGVNDSGKVDFSRISLGGDTLSSGMNW